MTMRRAIRYTLVILIALLPLFPARAECIPLPKPLDALVDELLGVPPNISPGDSLNAPQAPQKRPAVAKTPQNILPLFLGIPYRADGTVNDEGQYALFNKPDTPLRTPGLNCSGFVLEAARIILDKNITLADAVRDRENDSGPGSPLGHDWDFGFDFIMNISEGFPRSLVAPSGTAVPERPTGQTAPSFDFSATAFAPDLKAKMKPDALYLLSFSRHKTLSAPAHLHYHTGAAVLDKGALWVYSTTHSSGKVIRHNLSTEEGLARFLRSFKSAPGSYKRLTVVEIRIQ